MPSPPVYLSVSFMSYADMMITQYDKIAKEGDILVLQGIDVLAKDDFKILKSKKIGLITNHSFVE